MIDRELARQLEHVARRIRQTRLFWMLAFTWSACAAIGIALFVTFFGRDTVSGWPVPTLIAAAAVGAAMCALFARQSVRDNEQIARRVEAKYPDLNSRLLTAVEQEPEFGYAGYGFLQQTVIQETLSHARQHPWRETVPERRLWLAQLSSVVSLVLLALVIGGLSALGRSAGSLGSTLLTSKAVDPATRFRVTVEPGDTEVERGLSVLVTARFKGTVPDEVTLAYRDAAGEVVQLPMSRSLDDPLFGARIAAVNTDTNYGIAYADETSREYKIKVFDYPALVRADAKLVFPQYTALDETLVEDTRQVTAVEGTELTLLCHLNKPVADARLVSEEGEPLELKPIDDDPTHVATTIVLQDSRRYKLHLRDAENRANKEPPEIVVNVTRNQPPEVKIAWPGRDKAVSPIEELGLKAEVWDDFGLASYGLTYTYADAPPAELVLGQSIAPKEKQTAEHTIDFESLDAQPDQLVSYYFWAEDAGPDGKPRRTYGDMFFAEVRHFEEMFYDGGVHEGEPGKGIDAEVEKLPELQKQIINATWKLIRRETGPQPTNEFDADSLVVVESQQKAIQMADDLAQKIRDPQSRQYLATAREHMRQALKQLTTANAIPDVDALRPALASERAAYEALLKLRARQHLVVKEKGSGKKPKTPQDLQQQLDQLELKKSDDRYETERQAQRQDDQQRETRQVLNRLRELAQRQEDINKQLQQLQTALDAAKTEEEREAIRRQLKRLREQQQQILRDVDELKNRMDRPENQQQMAEAQRKLEETRNNVRRASEALERERLSQALTSGTRAGREFKELRDEFRKQAAGRFTEEMKQMRADAQKLDDREQQISEQLANIDGGKKRSLRDDTGREAIQQGLQQQTSELDDLLNRMQETIQQAEQAEPLLSKQLYDTLRKARHQKLADTLDTTQQLLQRGFLPDAQQTEQQARQGISDLNKGVRRAARSVLGDEDEALRRAADELQQLADQLNQELALADPSQQPNGGQSPRGDSQSPNQPSGEKSAEGKTSEGQSQEASEQQGEGNRDPSQQGQDSGQPADGQQGSSPSQQPGQSQSPSQQPGQQDGQKGQGQGQGQSPGQSQSQSQSPSQSQGERQGQSGQGNSQQPSGQQSPDQPNQSRNGRGNGSLRGSPPDDQQGLAEIFGPGSGPGPARPLTGDDFSEWSDRMRDVEEMLDDDELRGEVARIRDRARGVRSEFKRHSKEPNWDLVRTTIVEPLNEIQRQVAEELLRRQSKDALVPIDRDPVPAEYIEQVRRYYERLGSGQ